MFMPALPARTDWEAPKAETAYLDNERREGIVSDTDSRTDDCWGKGASFILATQAIVRLGSISVGITGLGALFASGLMI